MYEDNQPNQNRFIGRLITALAIALIGYFMYLNQVEVNPVTGEKQHVAISPDQEIRLGLETAPQMSREMGGELPSNDPRTIEVKKIGNYLVSHTEASKSPWQFNFHLLADDNTINAFALPGGQIFITLGLLNKLQTEAQLAGVLGHEMGHVIERHTAEQMAKSNLGQTLVMAVATGASDTPMNSNAAMVAALVNQMVQLRYGRKDESEADIWGIKLISSVGFDPHAMIDVMEILEQSGGSRGPEMFQTHPDPQLRIKQIKAYLAEHPPKENLSQGKRLKDILNRSLYSQ